jgi:hypothetical protein
MRLPDARDSFQSIGLDYDNTFTADPGLWRMFVAACRERGHTVYVTTARHANNVADIEVNLPGVEIFASGGALKREFCKAHGVEIDIWIDDMPWLIGGDFDLSYLVKP